MAYEARLAKARGQFAFKYFQAIGAARRKAQQELRVEYGKSILMDYSYRHFYHDHGDWKSAR